MATPIVIHGHFYQPPRENPWTAYVDREPSATPFHDWNARIHAECYRPNAYARILDGYSRVERIVNNYAHLSFNFGPTLLSWLEVHHPITYVRILDADRISREQRGGHGNAIAQGYNHAILPLCDPLDRLTQVRWGIADFRHRFGRDPEGMWLPETACTDAVLGDLIDHGIAFTILSPRQAERVRKLGEEEAEWQSVAEGGIDTTCAYRYFHRDGSGRSLTLFFYDGTIAQAIAFEGIAASSQAFLDRIERAGHGESRLLHVATDGESYGHHTKFGDRALAYLLEVMAAGRGFEFTNYGAYLERHPPTMEVEIKSGPNGEGTSWSCAHGVGRWYRDCGCRTGGQEGWNQAWRQPLRNALDFLRDETRKVYEAQAGDVFKDPWAARDAYIRLVLDRTGPREWYFEQFAGRLPPEPERVRLLTLLEMQRQTLLMYTSCGWFFNDLSGIETVQVLKYAGRAMDLMQDVRADPPREAFLSLLAHAQSNIPELGHGADIFRRFVDPIRAAPQRIASHLGIASLMDGEQEVGMAANYRFVRRDYRKEERGRLTMSTCQLMLESLETGRRDEYAVASMYLGGVDFYCVLRPFSNPSRFRTSTTQLWESFATASLPALLRIAQKGFGPDEFGLEHLLPEGRQRIAEIVFGNMVHRFSEQYARLYEDNRRGIEMLQEAGFEVPAELRAAAEFTLGRRFEDEIRSQHKSLDQAAYAQAVEIAGEAAHHGYQFDRSAANALFSALIEGIVELAAAQLQEENLRTALAMTMLTRKLRLTPNLERPQEIVYEALMRLSGTVPEALAELAALLGLAPGIVGVKPRAPTPA
ncbi:MAG: DUF3536 domain-containing protein [Candidatus Lambdaproteobacteria bacterium]|nr:DUF3536 domain-containing protein [Candidatus Lambdaproteobacteria bacterium]